MPLMLVSLDAIGINVSVNGTIIFLGQDDRNEVQYDFLCHMVPMAMASVSCDANSLVNATIALPRSG